MTNLKKTNKQIIYDILKDGKPHYDREFLNAGLTEYRRRISDLREEGRVINSLWITDPITKAKRPGYQLLTAFTEEEKEREKPKFTLIGKEHLVNNVKTIPVTHKEEQLFFEDIA